MTCRPCAFIRQLVLNLLLVLDMLANVCLLGRPGETISGRLGRAEAAGSRAAHAFCRWLNWMSGKHCRRAADPTTPSLGRELWHWPPPPAPPAA